MSKPAFKGVPTGGINEIRDYLIYLVDELSYLLTSVDTDNMTDDMRKLIAGKKGDDSDG